MGFSRKKLTENHTRLMARNAFYRDYGYDVGKNVPFIVSMNAMHHVVHVRDVVLEALRVVKPTGRIVLADFSRTGFRIMEKIPRAEGRTHEHCRYRFQELVQWFAAQGWRAVLRSRDCEDVLIATKQPAKK